ncbi:MAG: hypothetical protein N3D84_00285 [Candidatus Woesearchaeota archaeon]|nr:hypothetical protein [Candidatus Woesearchaeota archaeon]
MQCLVVYNTKENIDFLINNWELFSKFNNNFSIFFVNPFSKTEKRWAIYPMTHDIIAERKNLRQSINVLASNVEIITKEEIERIIK